MQDFQEWMRVIRELIFKSLPFLGTFSPNWLVLTVSVLKVSARAGFMGMDLCGSIGACSWSNTLCHSLEILNNFFKQGSLSFCSLSHKLCSWSCIQASFWFCLTTTPFPNSSFPSLEKKLYLSRVSVSKSHCPGRRKKWRMSKLLAANKGTVQNID